MKSKGIGCSELADVFNLDYGCQRRLFYKKREYKEDRPRLDDAPLRRGKALEAVAVEEYERKTGIKTRKRRTMLESTECPLIGYVDRIVIDKVLEIKCPGLHAFNKVKKEGISDSYILQLNGYIYLYGQSNFGIFGVFHPDPMEILDFEMERDLKIIDNIKRGTTELWSMIEGDRPPERLDMGDFRCKKCVYLDTCWQEKAMTIDGVDPNEEIEDLSQLGQLYEACKINHDAKEQINCLII